MSDVTTARAPGWYWGRNKGADQWQWIVEWDGRWWDDNWPDEWVRDHWDIGPRIPSPAERPAPDAGEWNAAIEAAARCIEQQESGYPDGYDSMVKCGHAAAIRALTRPAPAGGRDE